jgi:hypothetical protein
MPPRKVDEMGHGMLGWSSSWGRSILGSSMWTSSK